MASLASIETNEEKPESVITAAASIAWKAFCYCRNHPVVTQTLSKFHPTQQVPNPVRRLVCRCQECSRPRHQNYQTSTKVSVEQPKSFSSNVVRIIEDWDGGSIVGTDADIESDPSIPRMSIPSLIRDGPLLQESFACARRLWLNDGRIQREWFCDILTEDTLVPVRCSSGDCADPLDDAGRATECATKYMTIQEYITNILDDIDTSGSNTAASYYLKDWHLQWFLERRRTEPLDLPVATGISESMITLPSESSLLYTLPKFLPFDLLNGFLLRFGSTSLDETNDYRFVYWGPKGSTTGLHMDVLQSLSWSYNVCGEKEWVFYVPTKGSNEEEVSFTVRQSAGELLVVPSGWKHSVINLEETLSINHNWITADILSDVWTCIKAEMRAVDIELSAWSIDDFGARESMLCGCVGLNVSLFCFMILTRGLDILHDILETPNATCLRNSIQDFVFICQSLQLLCRTDSMRDYEVNLTERLSAFLQNEKASHQVISIVKVMIEFMDEN